MDSERLIREAAVEMFREKGYRFYPTTFSPLQAWVRIVTLVELMAVHTASCLVIEDAISGVVAGKTSGAKVLALTTSFHSDEVAFATDLL